LISGSRTIDRFVRKEIVFEPCTIARLNPFQHRGIAFRIAEGSLWPLTDERMDAELGMAHCC
jgi:hypothetical protein